MSLESAVDEERQEVMNILEGKTGPSRSRAGSSTGAFGQNDWNAAPAAPVRSMLDVGEPVAPVRSMLDVGEPSTPELAGYRMGATSPPPKRSSRPPSIRSVRSLRDSDPPISPHSPYSNKSTISPTLPYEPASGIHRTRSDASAHLPESRRRVSTDRNSLALDYQFEMLPSIASQALPKRVTQGGKKSSIMPSSMASIVQGQELGYLPRRHNSTAGMVGPKSRSPSSRLGHRQQSPGGSLLNTNSFNPMTTPGTFVTDAGKVIDLNVAYRRLSDAALLKSGGNLSNLPGRNSERVRADSGEALSPTGGIRLQKDYYNDHESENGAAIESSDEEKDDLSSGDETWDSEHPRGRKRSRRTKGSEGAEADWEDSENEGLRRQEQEGPQGTRRASQPRMVKSLLAAAEEERKLPLPSAEFIMSDQNLNI